MNETIKDLYVEINNLQSKINKIKEIEQEGVIKELKSLEWIKNCTGTFQINPLRAAGIPLYKIQLRKYEIPKYEGTLHIYGEQYPFGVTFYNKTCDFMNDGPYLGCSCGKNLFNFLDTVKFKKLWYHEMDTEILIKVKQKAKEYESN